jgi:hypothetical protein
LGVLKNDHCRLAQVSDRRTAASSPTINQLMEDRDVDGAAGRITKEDMEIKLNSNQNKNGPQGPFRQ